MTYICRSDYLHSKQVLNSHKMENNIALRSKRSFRLASNTRIEHKTICSGKKWKIIIYVRVCMGVFRDYHCDKVEIYTCIFLTLFLSLRRFKLRGSNCSSRPRCHAPLSAQRATIRTIRHYPHNAPLFAQPPPSRAPFVTRFEALRHRRVSPQPVTRVEYRRPGTTGYRCVEAWGWRAGRECWNEQGNVLWWGEMYSWICI